MKRDLDLIRDCLLAIDAKKDQSLLTAERLLQHDEDSVNYNLGLLLAEGYINGHVRKLMRDGAKPFPILVQDLTWAGHELLDAIRSDAIWQQTKEAAQNAGSFTVDLLKGLAIDLGAAALRRAAGLDD